MLLGIALHGAISFIPGSTFWAVHDTETSSGFGIAMGLIHGFRMPLFFLVSGFFTAMLWRKRGLKSLLTQRAQRILLPLVIALFTIIPANWMVGAYVSAKPNAAQAEATPADEQPPWIAAAKGEIAEVEAWISGGGNVEARIDDGATALHIAILFGRVDVVELLLESGANIYATNHKGERCIDVMGAPWGITSFIAGIVSVDVNQQDLVEGRRAIAKILDERTSSSEASDLLRVASMHPDSGPVQPESWFQSVIRGLVEFPLLGHLWFLSFLCWLVAGFAIAISVGRAMGVPRMPEWISISGYRYLWLVPITAIAQSFMKEGTLTFGPDTSIGLLPMPHVLAYYAIFFAFGALYFDAEYFQTGNSSRPVGQRWLLAIPVSILVLYPAGLAAASRDTETARIVSVLCQASYAWLMSFAMMGLFRYLMPRENKTMRYLSDASYWMYLAHIPLIILVQYWVRDVSAPALLKFIVVCVVTSGILLVSYQIFVRYTPIGTMLNGKRSRKVTTKNTIDGVLAQTP